MRFTHIDVNFDVKYEGHQNCSQTLSIHILSVFGHHHMWGQNWHQYVWTSLCQFIFLWTSSIVHVFDFLTFDIFLTTLHLFDNFTSFWQLDIFLTTWHLFWHMGNGTHEQKGIMVNTADRDGAPGGMGHLGGWGHMGDGVHGHNFFNTWGIFTKI